MPDRLPRGSAVSSRNIEVSALIARSATDGGRLSHFVATGVTPPAPHRPSAMLAGANAMRPSPPVHVGSDERRLRDRPGSGSVEPLPGPLIGKQRPAPGSRTRRRSGFGSADRELDASVPRRGRSATGTRAPRRSCAGPSPPPPERPQFPQRRAGFARYGRQFRCVAPSSTGQPHSGLPGRLHGDRAPPGRRVARPGDWGAARGRQVRPAERFGDGLSASLQESAVVLPAETEPPGSRLVTS